LHSASAATADVGRSYPRTRTRLDSLVVIEWLYECAESTAHEGRASATGGPATAYSYWATETAGVPIHSPLSSSQSAPVSQHRPAH